MFNMYNYDYDPLKNIIPKTTVPKDDDEDSIPYVNDPDPYGDDDFDDDIDD